MYKELEDRLSVADIHRRYAFCLDSRQPQLLGEVFAEDADAIYGFGAIDGAWRGLDEVIAGIEEKMERFEASCHFVGNVDVQLEGDAARTTAYISAWYWLTNPGAPAERAADLVLCSVFIDDVRRVGSDWRIARRRCRPLGPSHLAAGSLPAAFRPPTAS